MAHYAFLDENNVVTEVIVGRNEWEVVDGVSDWEEWYGNFRGQKCVRTSYNNNIRKQYAGIGFTYDPVADVFIQPKPFPSWVLNENNDWDPPVPCPDDMATEPLETGILYDWNEDELRWVPVSYQQGDDFGEQFID
jgi:hypothetical protein